VATRKEFRRLGEVKTQVSNKDPLIHSLAVAPDGNTLAAGRHDGSVSLWDTSTGKELRLWKADELPVVALSFSPKDKVLASGSWQGIRLWEAETGRRLDPYVEELGWPRKIVVSPDGKALAAGCFNSTLRLFDARQGKQRAEVTLAPYSLGDFAFSPDSQRLAFVEAPFFPDGPRNNRIRLLDTASGRDAGVLLERAEMIRYIAFSPNGDGIAGWGANDYCLWDAHTGKELKRFRGPQNAVSSFGYSPDGRLLATSGQGDANALWDPIKGKKVRDLGPIEFWNQGFLAFSPDGKTAALPGGQWGKDQGSQDPTEIILRETATGRERCRLTHHVYQPKSAAFCPKGRIIAVGGHREETIRLWDAYTGQEIGQLAGHRGGIDCMCFLPDGNTLISGSADCTILFWDMRKFEVERKLAVDKLGQEGLNAMWADLAHPDAARAYQAIRTLAEHPNEASAFLWELLEKTTKVDPKVIAQLISNLDNNQFEVREKASGELGKLGYLAESALRQALERKTSNEQQHRMKLLLEKLEDQGNDLVRIRVLRGLEVLERIGTKQAREVLHQLQNSSGGLLSEEAKASLERLAKRPGSKS
jgi:WD40 repeat protein